MTKTTTKTLIATAALLLSASVQAADSRQQFIAGNPDSDVGSARYQGMAATAPSVGGHLDRYQGIAQGNPDLFGFSGGTAMPHMRPDIYGPFGASPDLVY
jgi:opacity protein-like surface antigen